MKTNLIDNRQIRVFISSTFQDMQDERDYLMKRTFPMLRKLAAERDVTLTELDLRWGITEEESKSGKVVEICLREIENSIPFFIGIIGNRYGWVPEKKDISENVTDRFKDVDSYLERHLSVTEMEMQFGVLQRQEDMHAFFYIKEGEDKKDADNPEMLERLKKEVKASRYPSTTYSSPENLGIQVEQAFRTLLDQLFPEGHLSELEKERIGQRSFMNQLCQNYIRDDKNFQVIDEWMSDWDQHQLVITGASGLGKSALIANWLKEKLSDENRGYNIIYHFTGNGESLCSHESLKLRLADEIKSVYGWEDEKENEGVKGMSSDESKDKTVNANMLNDLFVKVAVKGDKPLLIILDAVNQIVDRDNAKLLNWLPIPPPNIKLLFSTLENDRTMEVFRNRKYPIFTLKPLNEESRRYLVVNYLNLFGKKLSDAQITRIVTNSKCENTLVLKTLLNELINYGVFEKLDTKINYYLSSSSIEDFYQAVLCSYESDYGKDFICHVLSLIAVSKNGLTEDEILSLTKSTPYRWSQFYCSIISHMTQQNGLINFSHIYIHNAIVTRYITNNSIYAFDCRLEIVRLMELKKYHRAQVEIPYLYLHMKAYDLLHSFLLNIDNFNCLYVENVYELKNYWLFLTNAEEEGTELDDFLRSNTTYNLSDYLPLLKDADLKTCQRFCIFCSDIMANFEIAKSVAEIIIEKARLLNVHSKELSDSFEVVGDVYTNLCYYTKALEYHSKALNIREGNQEGCHSDVATLYNKIGNVFSSLSNYDKALEYHIKALQILQALFDDSNYEVAISYNNIGTTYEHLGDNDKALEYYSKSLNILLHLPNEHHIILAKSYFNIGKIYYALRDYKKARDFHDKSLHIAKNILGEDHPFIAKIYDAIGKVQEVDEPIDDLFNIKLGYTEESNTYLAIDYFTMALEIREKAYGECHPSTATSFFNIGNYYNTHFLYNFALDNLSKSLKILKDIYGEFHTDIATTYRIIGNTYSNREDYDKAIENYLKSLNILQFLFVDNHPDIAKCFNNIGLVYSDLGDYDKALQYHQKALDIKEKVLGKEHPDTANSYYNIGLVYKKRGDYDKALDFFHNALKTREEVFGENHSLVNDVNSSISFVYSKMGKYEKAIIYEKKVLQYHINEEGEQSIITAYSYNAVGNQYLYLEQYDDALEYVGRALTIAKSLKENNQSNNYNVNMGRIVANEFDTIACFHNRMGRIYQQKGDMHAAVSHFRQCISLCTNDNEDTVDSKQRLEQITGEKIVTEPDIQSSLQNITKAEKREGLFKRILSFFNRK